MEMSVSRGAPACLKSEGNGARNVRELEQLRNQEGNVAEVMMSAWNFCQQLHKFPLKVEISGVV